MKSGVTLGGAVGAAVLPNLALILGWRNALSSVAVVLIALQTLGIVLYRESPGQASVEAPVVGLREFRQAKS